MDKKLLALAPEAKKYIALSVLWKWVGLLATIFIMMRLGWVFQDLLVGVRTVPWAALALVGAAACVRALSGVLAQGAGDKAALAAKRQVRQKVFDKLLRLGPSYQEKVGTAEAVQLAIDGAQQLEVYFGAYLPQLVFALIAPLTLFVALAPINLPAAFVLALGVPLVPGLIMGVRKAAHNAADVYWGSYGDLGTSFLEDIEGLTTLKIFQADEDRHARMNDEAQKFRSATMGLLSVQLRSIVAMDLVVFVGAAAGIIVAATQLSAGALWFAGAFTIVFLAQEFFLPVRTLGSLFHSAMNGVAAADRMHELLAMPEPAAGGRNELPEDITMACDGVSYSYDRSRQILRGVDAVFPQGGFCGIVGESGCGKSTLAGILSGRLAGYAGSVTLGGVDLHEFSPELLARSITSVPTNGMLFAGTVRENLALGNPEADDDRMWEVLAQCRIADYLRSASGLDTPVAEASSNFSGGQRQRLVLARALLHDSPIYLFDEATSNIDAESEEAIGRVIAQLAEDKTVIVISHRLSAVEHANRIYALADGVVAESGTHEELLLGGGVYAHLWQSQQHLEKLARDFSQEEPDGGMPAEPAFRTARPKGRSASEPPRHRSPLRIMGRLISLLGGLKPHMSLAITLGALGHLAAIALMTAGAYALCRTVARFGGMSLFALCLAVAFFGVVRGPLRYGEQMANHFIAFSILAVIRDKVYAALRRLAPAKLEGRSKGDLVSLATADIELLEVFYAHTISPVAIAFIVSLAMVCWLAATSPWMALIALAAYLTVGVALPMAGNRVSGTAGRTLRDGTGRLNAYVLESLRGLRELIQFGAARRRGLNLGRRTEELGTVELAYKRRDGVVAACADVVIIGFDIAMIVAAIALMGQGSIVFSEALGGVAAFMSSFGPVIAVMRLGGGLAGTLASGDRVLDLLDEEPETPDVPDDGGDEEAGAPVRVSHVSFSYEGEEVLRDIDFALERGRVLALEGASGSGKSTLLKLLMRFWDVGSGSITYNGADVRGIPTRRLRESLGYMTQDTHLFSGTLGDNILLARPDATPDQLRRACEKARIMDFVDRLPRGFETPVGELGDTMSGGERQRVGLARIFLQDAPIILLDEPTSNLDALNEAAVIDALDQGRAGKTVVIVSHRASTVGFADVRYVLPDRTS
ncbi:thiol reductant ABC exporter subunit CydC [Curtanaerobium respiraculi]|uniref:thiol reductant ABC exporter subunit CydC n=1 Tax=Curtanaerobium respiraculi TaxID=2949669 RepID=UPI0024B3594D|nr:thiol reductant ABC exporter subunit CydC [Curtanaerobium respiraculi]